MKRSQFNRPSTRIAGRQSSEPSLRHRARPILLQNGVNKGELATFLWTKDRRGGVTFYIDHG